jgi:N-acetylglucosaminyldiphosphoundecaprenol N-acetyl-beta-D-mannosaminyltransferase
MIRKKIISILVNSISYQDAINHVLKLAKDKTSSYVCFANAHMTIEAHENKAFAEVVNNSTLTLADGMPLVHAFKKLYNIQQDRIAGIDFMPDLIYECEKLHLSIFLFGSTQLVLDKLKEELIHKYPNLKIAGTFSPPYKQQFDDLDNQIFINTINNSKSDVVFVSLGCPKQETWMAKHTNLIKAPLLGVGAAFEIHAKVTKRAPIWMQKSSLEWLYRFMQEPKRLFKRYFKTNSLFMALFLKAQFSKK